MQAYAYNLTVQQKGTLTLHNRPFSAGEEIEVIIIPRSKPSQQERERYPFWGKPIIYPDPTEPLPETDWEVYQ
jgi:hypothetical protein